MYTFNIYIGCLWLQYIQYINRYKQLHKSSCFVHKLPKITWDTRMMNAIDFTPIPGNILIGGNGV